MERFKDWTKSFLVGLLPVALLISFIIAIKYFFSDTVAIIIYASVIYAPILVLLGKAIRNYRNLW